MIRSLWERWSSFFKGDGASPGGPWLAPAPRGLALFAALAAFAGLVAAEQWLRAHEAESSRALARVEEYRRQALQSRSELRSFAKLKSQGVERFKKGLSSLARSRRSLFEAGIDLQDQKRVLEKVWEIASTYVSIDVPGRKVRLMRGDQALQSFPIAYAPPAAFGGEKAAVANFERIVSKERFAAPERGQYVEMNGRLLWEPPQVGSSRRANALGAYVLFTNGPLILHGPPQSRSDHEAFAHDCLGLSLYAATKLFAGSYIGTRVVFDPPLSSLKTIVPSPAAKKISRAPKKAVARKKRR